MCLGLRVAQMLPFVNSTVESAHLSLQGRQEAYSMKVFASVAASSFNPQLGMWEPLLEPFHSIFKYVPTWTTDQSVLASMVRTSSYSVSGGKWQILPHQIPS